MVPPNNLGLDLSGKAVNETQYRGTPNLGLWYQKCSGKLVCWSAKKQQYVAMSLVEAEYIVAAGCCANILWMKSQLTDYDIIYEKVPIFCDNTSAIAISNNPVLHSRMKHIDIRYHFIRDHILKGYIELHFTPTQYQLADIFTKPLDEPTFKRLIVELDQIEFTFEEISITTNNEVALLYPSHPNSEYFREVSDFISKCCLKEAFIKAPTQYKEYLSEFWNALRAHYLPHSSMYVSPPSITIVRPWFATIGGKTGGLDQISNKDATILYCLANEAICNLDVHVDSKAPKPSSQTKEVPQGKNPGAKSGLRRKKSSKHTSESKTKASKSKTSQSKKETQSRSAKDKNPSHPSPPTLVVSEMHKEAQQAACGLTSLGATSEEGVHPQLSSGHDASTDSTTETDHGLSAPNDSIPSQQDQTKSGGDGLKTAQND
ncbi:hypothetical protein Tco_1064501 [Tanacetum coccineum]